MELNVISITENFWKSHTDCSDNCGSEDDSIWPIPVVKRLSARYGDPLACSIGHHLPETKKKRRSYECKTKGPHNINTFRNLATSKHKALKIKVNWLNCLKRSIDFLGNFVDSKPSLKHFSLRWLLLRSGAVRRTWIIHLYSAGCQLHASSISFTTSFLWYIDSISSTNEVKRQLGTLEVCL